MAPTTKRIILAIVALIILGSIISIALLPNGKARYTTVDITQGNLEDTVTAQGRLEPKEYVEIGARVTGQLEKLYVNLGDAVKEGDLVAEIDAEQFEAEVAADAARLETLKLQFKEQEAVVEQVRLIDERNQELIKIKAISQEEYEDSLTDYRVAKTRLSSLDAQIQEAKSTLEARKTNLSYTKIYSPMNGTVVSQSAREGETLNANQTTPTIIQVADLDKMIVRAQVAEADIPKIKQGMDMYFTILGIQDRRWEGIVNQILPIPEIVLDVVLYNVLIDVDNSDGVLMSDMSAQIFFVLGKTTNAPLIPVSALGQRMKQADVDFAKGYKVFVLNDGNVQEKTILVGLMNRSHAEVVDGLMPGDKVILPETLSNKT